MGAHTEEFFEELRRIPALYPVFPWLHESREQDRMWLQAQERRASRQEIQST